MISDLKLSDIAEDAYTPQQIFSQVWEAPYEWFGICPHTEGNTSTLPTVVDELEYNDGFTPSTVDHYEVTEEMIEQAAFKFFDEIIRKDPSRKLSDFVVDMDANDVDAILQLACFGEIRYG